MKQQPGIMSEGNIDIPWSGQPLAAHLAIQWRMEDESKAYPNHKIYVHSDRYGTLSGYIPEKWNGKERHIHLNDKLLR